jgi:hypothetical protein
MPRGGQLAEGIGQAFQGTGGRHVARLFIYGPSECLESLYNALPNFYIVNQAWIMIIRSMCAEIINR